MRTVTISYLFTCEKQLIKNYLIERLQSLTFITTAMRFYNLMIYCKTIGIGHGTER